MLSMPLAASLGKRQRAGEITQVRWHIMDGEIFLQYGSDVTARLAPPSASVQFHFAPSLQPLAAVCTVFELG